MTKRRSVKCLIFGFAFFLAGLLLVSCGKKSDTIKIGIILPLTGDLAKFGEIEKNSFMMALEEINALGAVHGKKLELVIEDTQGKPEIARSALEKLVTQDKVVMIGGGYSSSETYAAVSVAQKQKVPFLVNTGAADNITEQGYEYIFRLNPPVSEYPSSLESFLKESAKDVKTAVILFENSLFGQSGSKEFEAQATKWGLKVLLKEGYAKGAIDFKPLLTKVREKNPDLIYMISYYMDASLLIRQSMELNINPKLFVGGAAGFTLPEFLKNSGKATEYVYSATLWTPTVPYKGAKEYYDKYLNKFKEPTEYHGAEAYAAMYVIADAIKRAKTPAPADIREALTKTDMMTVFGPVKFISYGKMTQQNKLPTFLVQWQNGQLETVWPKDVATKKYIYPIPPWNARK